MDGKRAHRWLGLAIAVAVVGGGAGAARAVCGNGVLEPGEECDDGNNNNHDDCITDSGAEIFCRLPTCGDTYVHDQGTGTEQCDDGNTDDTDACARCMNARCGDGFIHAGVEQCDDGNTLDTDTCVGACVPARCGDRFVETGVEQCDDGDNADQTDACVRDAGGHGCIAARCGDGLVHAGVEQCDDANADEDDACTSVCRPPVCGDGIVHPLLGEVCDDGASNGADPFSGCAADCTPAGVVARSGACAAGGGAGLGLLVLVALVVLAIARRRRRRRGPLPIVVALLLVVGARARAAAADADGFRLSRFSPAPSLDDGLGLTLPSTLDARRWSAMLTLDFGRTPFLLHSTGTMATVTRDIIASALLGHLDVALGLGDRYQLDVELPLVITQDASAGMIGGAPYAAGRTALGDGRLGGAVRLLGDRGPGFGLGAAADVLIPMGSADDFAGDGRIGVHAHLLAAYVWPRLTAAIDTGVEVRPDRRFADVRFGPELVSHLGVQVPATAKLTLLAELASALPLTSQEDGVPRPFEVLAGGRYRLGPWVAGLGAGVGLTDAVGVPRWRVLLTIGRTSQKAPPRPPPPPTPTTTPPPPPPPEPTADADHDGIVDTDDRCPSEPESKNGHDDADGCPDAQVDLQQVLKEMADRILFDFDHAELDDDDRKVLAEVAALLAATPEIERLSVEGHASSEGSDAYNDDLSRRRAQAAIDGLIAAGVDPARLQSAHFGEARPFLPNTTEDRRKQNRRVEFHIVQFHGSATPATTP